MHIAIDQKQIDSVASRLGWYWYICSANNRVLAVSWRTYKNRSSAIRAAQIILDHAIFDMDIVDRSPEGRRKPKQSEKDQHYGR